jgi:hypothetical protein
VIVMTLVRSVPVLFIRYTSATLLRRRLPLLLWEASWLTLAAREGGPHPPQSDGSFAALFYDGGSGVTAISRRRIGSLQRATLMGSLLFSLFFSARSFASVTCLQ